MGSGYSSEEELEDDQPKKNKAMFNQGQQVKVVPPQMSVSVKATASVPPFSSLPSPGREQGDGMEKPTEPVTQPAEMKPKEILDHFSKDANLIELPEAGLKLTKLPPITDTTVVIPPVVPKNPLVAVKPKMYPRGSFPPSSKRMKEPKFVPYEPYKGAVAFMETKRSGEKKFSRTNRSTSVESEVLERSDCDAIEVGTEPISKDLENNYRVMLDAKEREIQKLRENLDNAEKQLKIQSKVNTEIKNLLVASVGEDIEARVDFLTQDKARLAADVIEYNNRIATDWEKKEALGVESDVWRSKFLASTVIVEELTRTKQTIQQRAEDLEHLGRRLLLERTQLRSSVSTTQLTIDKLSQAFDPLNPVSCDPGQLDTLKAAGHLVQTSQALCARLVGQNKLSLPDLPTLHTVDSPAEAELKKVLARPLDTVGKVPDQACSVLAKGARLHLLKLGDVADAPHQHGQDQFKTCSHCSGTVQDV